MQPLAFNVYDQVKFNRFRVVTSEYIYWIVKEETIKCDRRDSVTKQLAVWGYKIIKFLSYIYFYLIWI